MQGWTMLGQHCPECFSPLMRNKNQEVSCVVCQKPYIIDEQHHVVVTVVFLMNSQSIEEEKVTNEECQQPAKKDHPEQKRVQYDPDIISYLHGYIKRCSLTLLHITDNTVDDELKIIECIQKTMDVIERMNQ